MQGMNMNTGQTMDGVQYLRQSIWRILSTPLGERVMRPEFGSELPNLVDHPFNPATRLAMEASISDALSRWEPSFDVDTVEVLMKTPGTVIINLTGTFDRQQISLTNIEIGRVSEIAI